MDGFWLGGCEAYLEALREDLEKRTSALNDQLKRASSADEIKELERQICEACTDYRQRVSRVQDCLF